MSSLSHERSTYGRVAEIFACAYRIPQDPIDWAEMTREFSLKTNDEIWHLLMDSTKELRNLPRTNYRLARMAEAYRLMATEF